MNIRNHSVYRIGARFFTALIFFGALLAALWAAFCLQQKWRAQRDWQAYVNSKGSIALSIEEVLPPNPKDEDNFAAIPMVRDLFENSDAVWFAPLKLSGGKRRPAWPHAPNGTQKTPFSLQAWASYFGETGVLATPSNNPANDVLAALETVRPELDALHSALQRPHTRFPVDWREDFRTPMPHLSAMMTAISVCNLRAAAHLEKGDSRTAAECLLDSVGLANRMGREPTLIASLVRNSGLTGAAGALHHGLTNGQWTPSELPKLQTLFSTGLESETTRAWATALNGERALFNQISYRLLNTSDNRAIQNLMGPYLPGKPSPFWVLYPAGWFIQSQIRMNQRLDSLARSAESVFSGPPPSEWMDKPDPAPEKGLRRLKWLMSEMAAPGYQSCLVSFIRSLCLSRQAALAIALEEAFQKNGTFPESLDSLPLEKLGSAALDPIDRLSMRYQRTSPNAYRLWSVGAKAGDEQDATTPGTDAKKQPEWAWELTRKPNP
jgi:hypothetical protein